MNFNKQIVRVLLRYLAAALVAFGVLDGATAAGMANDEAIINLATTGLGVLISMVTEAKWVRELKKDGVL